MQLADILFTQGFGTRYDCRALVASSMVMIGDVVHNDPFEEIDTDGLVLTIRNQQWPYYEKALIALHKPAGYECSMKPSANPSVMTLLPGPLRVRGVQPIGRLDVDTTGLLLFTDDGVLHHRLIHPKKHVAKVYEVTCKHVITDDICDRLMKGVLLDDDPKPIAAKAAEKVSDYELKMTLVQGKYHQVKRMIAACSNRVERLHRSQIGNYMLPKELAPGEWLWLSDPQIVVGK